jgi:hypothetical protein
MARRFIVGVRRAIAKPVAAVFAVLALTAPFGGVASSAPPGQATGAAKTITHYVRPVNAQGHLNIGYRVVQTLNDATCQQESEFVSEAWRCFAGNYILDPCWAESGGVLRVVCQGIPWVKTVYRLNLSEPLEKVVPYKNSPAWGIRLETGNRCGFAEGATNVIDGLRLNYACQRNNVWLAGWIIRTRNPWRIHTVVQAGGTFKLGAVQSIKTVWRALPAVYQG